MIKKLILLSAFMLTINHVSANLISVNAYGGPNATGVWAHAAAGDKYAYAGVYLNCSVGRYCTNNVGATAINEYDVIFRPTSYWTQDGRTIPTYLDIGIDWLLIATGGARSSFQIKNTGIYHAAASGNNIVNYNGNDSHRLFYNAGLGYFSTTVILEALAAASWNGTAQVEVSYFSNALADPDFYITGDSKEYASYFSIEEQFNTVETNIFGSRPQDLPYNEVDTQYQNHINPPINVPEPSTFILFEFALLVLGIRRMISRHFLTL